MRNRKRAQTRAFSIFATFLMVLSLLTPGFAAAESKTNKLNHSVNGNQVTAKEKMGERLLSEFKGEEKVTFLVKFNEK